MTERVWDRYLSESDRRRAARQPAVRKGAGKRPALVLVDLYRAVFGDEPETVEAALDRWPNSCGMNAWNALPSIMKMLAGAREHGLPVFHITGHTNLPNWRDPRAGTLPQDTEAKARWTRRYRIVDELAPIEGELVLEKTAPSAFFGTLLTPLLIREGADTIIVVGESTSGCVRATVVDGKSYRFKVIVPEECVFDRDEAPHAINLFDMDQKYADVIPLEDVLAYLDEVAPVSALAGAR
jgi:nicotinamidase-related amidase